MHDNEVRSTGMPTPLISRGQLNKPLGEAGKRAMASAEDSAGEPGNDRCLPDRKAPTLPTTSALARSGKIVPWYFCVRRKGSRG